MLNYIKFRSIFYKLQDKLTLPIDYFEIADCFKDLPDQLSNFGQLSKYM